MNPVIAAIDPSLGSAAIFTGRVDCPHDELRGRVFTATDAVGALGPRMARWRAHAAAMRGFIAADNADILVLEGYSYGSNGRAIVTLAEFGGVLRMALLSLGKPILEVPPTSLKKFVTGKGNANKTEMVSALARRYGVDYRTDDEYDAFGLWLMGRVWHDPAHGNKEQRAVLAALS